MAMQTPQSGQVLSHYRLVEKIGEGGMGVVWKAQDTVLGRTVAIKVLPADVAGDETRRKMFFDEARLASSVSDAHIAQVHELGREGDLDFIVMEYVEGKPLHRILHGRPLPPDKVAALGHQVAQALSRAHRKGLVHRDLKPGNILVTPDGEAKVVDFGLAILFEARDATLASIAPDDLSTATHDYPEAGGAVRKRAGLVGTLQYMSPEQARAEKLDARSDIFSLGVVLYEMTTGQRPFGGATPAELLREVARARPRPPHELLPKIPLDLERIIVKAMAGAKAERYQTMDDMAVDLRRLSRDLESGSSPSFDDVRAAPATTRRPWVWAVVGVSAVAATVLAGWRFATSGRSAGDPRTVLILPMEVRGQSGDGEYVGHAFAEAIAVQLAQSKELNILPVPSQVEAPAGGARERGAAAAALGAGRLVTGSLTREGKVVRASLSLVDASRNRILWGLQKDDADGSLSGLAALFAAGIRTELGITPSKMYEYPFYMTGSGAMATAPETAAALGALRRFEVQPALEATERLVKAFPNDVDALVLRAYAVRRAVNTDLIEPDALEKAFMAVERVDPQNATAQNIKCDRLQDRPNSGQEVIHCADGLHSRTDLTPALRGWAFRVRASGKMSLGDLSGALQDIQQATQMDPTNPFNYQQLGLHEMKAGRFDAAATAYGQCSSLMPVYYACHGYRAEALVKSTRYAEAVDEARTACEIFPSRDLCAYLAFCLAKAGRSAEAQAAITSARAIKGENADGASDFARALLALGDRSAALRSLRVFANGPDAAYFKLDEDADFAALDENAEFKAIVMEQRATVARARSAGGAGRD